MGRISIGIYDREADYARKLGSYIRRRGQDMLEVKIFTRIEALEDCLNAGGLKMILAGKDAEALCLRHDQVRTMILSDEEGYGETGEVPYVGKYQSAEQIWKQVLVFSGDQFSGIAVSASREEKTEFLGICSPVHGCGKTVLGFFVSRVLGEQKQCPVLFLTLDEFSPLLGFAEESGGEAELSELFYYYSQRELTRARLQASVCRWGNIEYVPPVTIPEDLYPDNRPYEIGFFRELAKLGSYRYVVIDLGSTVWGKEKILGLCKRIYVPERGRETEKLQMEQFETWMELEGLKERMVRCRTPGEEMNFSSGLNRLFAGGFGRWAKELTERKGYGV